MQRPRLPLRGRPAVRRALGIGPQAFLNRRAGDDAHIQAHSQKLLHAHIAHVEHRIGDAARLRCGRYGPRRQKSMLVKIFSALIKGVQRFIGHALLLQILRQAALPGMQKHFVGALKGIHGLQRQLLAAKTASDHDDLRHAFISLRKI